jgi:hypothetical protein
MKSQINKILAEIEQKARDLKIEYDKLMEKYSFSFKNGKIIFNKDKKSQDKSKKNNIWYSVRNTRLREFLSIPFIYIMIIPILFLDVFLFIYQQTAMRLY